MSAQLAMASTTAYADGATPQVNDLPTQPAASTVVPPAPTATVVQPVDVTSRLALYEARTKSVALAIVLDVLLPGAGNVYVHDYLNAVITWAGLLAGTMLVMSQMECGYHGGRCYLEVDVAGLAVMGGAYLFGTISAGFAAASYNREIRAQLALPEVAMAWRPFLARVEQGAVGGFRASF